jgi:hypothetical protein
MKSNEPTHAQRFDLLIKQVLSVSKAEIDQREVSYKKQRTSKKKLSGGSG